MDVALPPDHPLSSDEGDVAAVDVCGVATAILISCVASIVIFWMPLAYFVVRFYRDLIRWTA